MFLQQQRNNNEIVNQNIINHSPNHEMVPLVNLNPKPNPDPSHINNPYFGGAPMIPGNHYPPYNNYPHMIPQQQFGIQSPTEYNYNDTANMNQNIAFDPIIPQYSNYNSEVSNRGHNIPPESFLPPIQFYQQNNHEQQQYPPNYGNFAMRY